MKSERTNKGSVLS